MMTEPRLFIEAWWRNNSALKWVTISVDSSLAENGDQAIAKNKYDTLENIDFLIQILSYLNNFNAYRKQVRKLLHFGSEI